jgi:hypothetical protein
VAGVNWAPPVELAGFGVPIGVAVPIVTGVPTVTGFPAGVGPTVTGPATVVSAEAGGVVAVALFPGMIVVIVVPCAAAGVEHIG